MSYVVAVVGGACAGSEITAQLVEQGFEVVVFEQNPLPYGKIEDGLPRWHYKLQLKEMNHIDKRLDQPSVHFMPLCALGKEVSVQEMVDTWQFPMVVMASGAWRDRKLRIPGVDEVQDHSFIYQNPFVYWFNHYEDKDYSGPQYQVPDGSVVIGGGLAGIDMIKIFQFETVKRALAERGLSCDLLDLEHKGIPKTLEKFNLTYEELGIKPGRLVYRKRVADMPLIPLGADASPERLAKAEKTREKLINNAKTKYLFEVHPLRSPMALHVEDGSVKGISFKVMAHENGRFIDTGEVERMDTRLVVSSIGSIPMPIEGVPMDGELYDWRDHFTGAVAGLDRFFCVGNAITGRGNIKDSAKNAKRLGKVIESAMEGDQIDFGALFRGQEDAAREQIPYLLDFLEHMPKTSASLREQIRNRVAAHHQHIGYEKYTAWRDKILSARGITR